MRAGDLDNLVKFFSPKSLPDGSGGTEEGWSEEFTVWTNIKYLRGSEIVLSARLSGKRPVIMTLRKSTDSERITPNWKAVFDGMDFNIREYPNPTENRLYLEFLAEGGVSVGA